jgi:hypothetical protein
VKIVLTVRTIGWTASVQLNANRDVALKYEYSKYFKHSDAFGYKKQ